MLPTKLLQPIPLTARIQVSKPDAHLPMHQDIHDVVNFTLRPASFNRCGSSTLGLFLPNIGWLGWRSPLHEFESMHRNNCSCIKLSQAPLLPLLHSKRCICDRKNILFVIVFGLILGINLAPLSAMTVAVLNSAKRLPSRCFTPKGTSVTGRTSSSSSYVASSLVSILPLLFSAASYSAPLLV